MLLAPGWEIERVIDALKKHNRRELAQFIETRYESRLFAPIFLLEKAAEQGIAWPKGAEDPDSPIRPYGFGIMSLACTMIETLECYVRGIPTTGTSDFARIKDEPLFLRIPSRFVCTKADIPGTGRAFRAFFERHQAEFANLDGEDFFNSIRNALLHQSQTRDGWVLQIHRPEEALSKVDEVFVGKALYRDSFIKKLHGCFVSFVKELRDNPTDANRWDNAERKIWWIAWLSDPDRTTDCW